ncbi:hypothetical protein DC20_10770 [Rufibacter tibetensis]|uniref:Uncharacterized protein n=2 Tax=Rufibacter tibetensis TaxID=512763 RepID=A0A0N7HWI8_9BACT|nr:hypothetical protein DC20_10770 [Rufibacter tibetensis]
MNRADARSEVGDFYGAIKDYTLAIVLLPALSCKAYVGRGNAFLEVGAYQEAIRDFDKILLVNASAEALYGRAVAKYYLDDYLGAIRDLDEVIAEAPEFPTALCNRGIMKLECNKLEEAVADLSLYLSINPEHQEALYAYSVAIKRLQKRAAKS